MKKLVLLSFLVSILSLSVFSQNRAAVRSDRTRIQGGYTETVYISGIITDLEARFAADVTSGVKPLTVHFTDESTGNPVTWAWDFGDGGVSAEQHPVHEYLTEGTYDVKLTVSDGTNSYALSKEKYIKVLPDQQNCDTLQFPLTGTYTYYVVTNGNSGYVSGNNSYQDKAKANYYFSYPPDSEIRGVLLEFAVATHGSGTNPSVTFTIWDNTGAQGSPGAVKATATLPLTQIVEDVANDRFTYAEFSNPIPINSPFYAGVILPTTAGDTVVLWTNTDGDVSPAIGWEQWSNNSWYPYSSSSSWALSISNAIFPVVCPSSQDANDILPSSAVSIFPNPASDKITVRFNQQHNQKIRISMFNIIGVRMNTIEVDPSIMSTTISLSGYTKGLYFLIIEAGRQKITRKIHVI